MALDAEIGWNAMVGLKEEVSWGTSAGDSDHFVPVTSVTGKVDTGVVTLPYLSGGVSPQTSHVPRDSVVTKHDAGVDLSGCFCYDDKGALLVLKHAMGAVATTGPSGSQYTHTFTLDVDGVVGLTAQLIHGFGLSNPSELYVGGKVSRYELEITAAGWLAFRASLINKSGGGMIAIAGSPAFTAAEEVLAHQGATLSHNARTYGLRRLKVTLDNALIRRPVIGSLYTDVPIPGGPASITVEIERSWEDHNLYTDFLAGVQADGSVVFTGTGDNQLTINLHNMRWTSVDKPVDRAGELTQRAVGMCFSNPTSEEGLSIVVKNSNSTAI